MSINGPVSETINALGAYLSNIFIPIIFLIVVVLADYATGLMKARYTKTLSSDVGYKGILKKLTYPAVIAVGIVVDWSIQSAALHSGMDIEVHATGIILTLWLIFTECISILENVSAMGVPVPAFLMAVVSRLKKTAEGEAEGKTEKVGLDKDAVLEVMTKLLISAHRPEDGELIDEAKYRKAAEHILTGEADTGDTQ